jgi:hypothetical protein
MLKQYKLLFLLKLSFPLQFFWFASFEVVFALQVWKFECLIVLVYYQFEFKSTLEFGSVFVLPFVKLFSSDHLSP